MAPFLEYPLGGVFCGGAGIMSLVVYPWHVDLSVGRDTRQVEMLVAL